MASKFRRGLENNPVVNFTPQKQLQDLFNRLQQGQKPANSQPLSNADLVLIGDYWLTAAIQQGLIQPFDPNQLPQWQQLPQRWQNLVKRNAEGQLDAKGQIWAAPYRWGTTVLIYRKDIFQSLGWKPTDWSDLWREELRDRISLLDQSREVIGLTLKKLGYSYNTKDFTPVANLKTDLEKLHQNALLYSSNNYLKPLILGDTWLAVGWSSDVPAKILQQNNLAVAVPQSGTALWTEVWVRPKQTETQTSSSLAEQWINFCWQPDVATQMSLLTGSTSPVVVNLKTNELPQELQTNPILLPSAQILEKSDFLLPLSPETMEKYQNLWDTIRRNVRN